MSSYSDKLKDPRWQKKRLQILQGHDFKCQSCGDTETELSVHHIYYEKDLNPWEYPDEAYLTLCKTCHERWHRLKYSMDRALCYVDIDQLNHLQGMVMIMSMMGPNVTMMFYDLMCGYQSRQIDKNDE